MVGWSRRRVGKEGKGPGGGHLARWEEEEEEVLGFAGGRQYKIYWVQS